MCAKYNATPCEPERKAAGAGTIENRRETMEVRARSRQKSPPMSSSGRQAHKTKTRIYAIAELGCDGK
jgi:hypothetical protein